jgi:LysR family hydrogen peroxide-inducible transcriptional activator
MNLQQLEYVIAVDKYRHFQKAAESCFITQATLSAMIKKLEEELDAVIFDRSKFPVQTTVAGVVIIEQAKIIMSEAYKMKEIVHDANHVVSGELRLAIIPTLAPYLLPLFLDKMIRKYPDLHIHISELTTEEIRKKLKNNDLEAGILATPLQDEDLKETVLFYEEFLLYSNAGNKLLKHKEISPADIDPSEMLLMNDGHCLRTQVLNICDMKKNARTEIKLNYQSGSVETLKEMVKLNLGSTILPELASRNMSKYEQKYLRKFKVPVPVREVSLVTYRLARKKKLVEVLKEMIENGITNDISAKSKKK